MAVSLFLGQIFQAFDNNGNPLASGTVEFYEVGTSTPKVVYSDKNTTTSIGSTITLDANGRKKIFLKDDYKAIFKDSLGNEIDTQDGGINAVSASESSSDNLIQNFSFETDSDSDGQPDNWDVTVYTGGTQTLDTTDQTHEATSIKFVSTGNGGGNIISESFIGISNSVALKCHFDLKSSVVDVRNLVQVTWYDSAKVSISSSVFYDNSTTNPTSWTRKCNAVIPPSTARYCKLEMYGCHSSDSTSGTTWFDNVYMTQSNKDVVGADIASAATLLANIPGDKHDVTGTTGITAIESFGKGSIKTLQFDGALTITNHATDLIIPGGNYTTSAGDIIQVHEYDDAKHRIISVTPSDGNPVAVDRAGIVAAGAISSGGIDSSGMFAAGVVDQSAIGSSAVGQGELKTTTASSSTAIGTNSSGSLALTGGLYSWWTMSSNKSVSNQPNAGFGSGDTAGGTIGLVNTDGGSSVTFYIDERYVQASPPYETNDGPIPLFCYVKIKKGRGELHGITVAPDPTWAYHGPTDINANIKRNGKEFKILTELEAEKGQAQVKKDLVSAILSGNTEIKEYIQDRLKNDKRVQVEVTKDFKNSDMDTHPHPWMLEKNSGFDIALLDPQNTLDLYDLHCCGENVLKMIEDGTVKIDNQPLQRIVPNGMKCYGYKF